MMDRCTFMMDRFTFLHFSKKIPIHCHYKAWKGQDIFNITLITSEKRMSYAPRMT